MKYRYRILYEDGETQELEASGLWIALVKTGAILKDSEVVSIVREEIPFAERIEGRMDEMIRAAGCA